MLKAKKNDNKKLSPAKVGKADSGKLKKLANKPPQAKQLKEKKDAKVKKVVKAGLVEKPPAVSSKVKSPKVKKVMDAEKLAAKREKRKQKKLEKKLKKAAAKKENAKNTNGIDTATQETQDQNESKEESDKLAVSAKPKKVPAKSAKKGASPSDGETTKQVPHTQLKPKQTVFVGNLPSNTKRVQLVKLFCKFGKIICVRFRTASGKVIFKHKARKEANSLNGYVVYENEESAVQALEMNNFEFKGHHLRVTPSEAEEQPRDPKRTIVVGNLKYSATDEKLYEIFSSCGPIEYVRTIQNGDKGCSGVAFVCFKSPDAVGLAVELKGTLVDDRPINVERYKTTKTGAQLKKEQEMKAKSQLEKGGPNKKKPNKKDGGSAKGLANGKKVGAKPKKPAGPKVGKAEGKGKKPGNPPKDQKEGAAEGAGPKKSKPEFRGAKSTIVKKKQKKVPSAMKKLAKKIAPKGDD